MQTHPDGASLAAQTFARTTPAFRGALRELLTLISTMTNEEIRRASDQLADLPMRTNDKDEMRHTQMKVAILDIYVDLRNSHRARQNKLRRRELQVAMGNYFEEQGRQLHRQAKHEHHRATEQILKERRQLVKTWKQQHAEWKSEVEKPRRLGGLFKGPPIPPPQPTLPLPPEQPARVREFISTSMAGADMSEYLINMALESKLLSIPENVDHVLREDIKRLA